MNVQKTCLIQFFGFHFLYKMRNKVKSWKIRLWHLITPHPNLVLNFLPAQLCHSFGFASTRFELRSPGFTRPKIRSPKGRGNKAQTKRGLQGVSPDCNLCCRKVSLIYKSDETSKNLKKKPAEPVKTLPHIREELERENLKLFLFPLLVLFHIVKISKRMWTEIVIILYTYPAFFLIKNAKSVVITIKVRFT